MSPLRRTQTISRTAFRPCSLQEVVEIAAFGDEYSDTTLWFAATLRSHVDLKTRHLQFVKKRRPPELGQQLRRMIHFLAASGIGAVNTQRASENRVLFAQKAVRSACQAFILECE